MKTVKCISNRLNHVVFGDDGKGRKPHRVQVGETFKVRNVPKNWSGLVAIVDDGAAKKVATAIDAGDDNDKRVAQTNPEGATPKPAPAAAKSAMPPPPPAKK